MAGNGSNPNPEPQKKSLLSLGIGIYIIAVFLAIIFSGFLTTLSDGNHETKVSIPSPTTPGSLPSRSLVPTVTINQKKDTTTSVFPESSRFTTLITITGQSGKISDTFSVPEGYWELWYTADPLTTGGQDSVSASGSNSAVFPYLSIQVIDKTNSDRVVETVEPPGGLDKTLWLKSGMDPRPWRQKFYEGNKNYYLVITTKNLKSYTIEARIPKIVSPISDIPVSSSAPTSRPLSAAISNSVMKTTDKFTIYGTAKFSPTINIVIRRCQTIGKCYDLNSFSTFDSSFTPKTFHPDVTNNTFSQLLNAAEFGPGQFNANITLPSSDQQTRLLFLIEE